MALVPRLVMRLAIPTWCDRVSPVFDVAGHLLLIDLDEGRETGREQTQIDESQLWPRAKRVAELGVNTLICGAISGPLEGALASLGVDVIPQVCGDVDEVLSAFLAGTLVDDAVLMPAFCGRRRRRHGRFGGRGRPRRQRPSNSFEEGTTRE